jgi:hypothetical protein
VSLAATLVSPLKSLPLMCKFLVVGPWGVLKAKEFKKKKKKKEKKRKKKGLWGLALKGSRTSFALVL